MQSSLDSSEQRSGSIQLCRTRGIEYLSQRGLKTLWASASFEDDSAASQCSSGEGDLLSEVLRYLLLQRAGKDSPLLHPRIVPLPIATLCQLALLWALAGEVEAAQRLAESIPFDFPWLWSSEAEYNEKETVLSIALLQRALGNAAAIDVGSDPFFKALLQRLPQIHSRSPSKNGLPWTDWQSGPLRCACTFTGDSSSLGAAVFPEGEIRAFGPQALPLGVSKGFGIRSVEGMGREWSSCSAAPEVWLKTSISCATNSLIFDVDFAGLRADAPLVFVFYVKAEAARIGSQVIQPRGLQKYFGEARPVCFNGLVIESRSGEKLEVIPLAGLDCFWGCEYLVAFHLNPFGFKSCFSVSLE